MDHQFYCEACDADHNPFNLFPCIELDLHQFLSTTYHIKILILQTTYWPEVDGWMMRIRDENLTIIVDAHQMFLEDKWEFTKLLLVFSYWPYETPWVWLKCSAKRPFEDHLKNYWIWCPLVSEGVLGWIMSRLPHVRVVFDYTKYFTWSYHLTINNPKVIWFWRTQIQW